MNALAKLAFSDVYDALTSRRQNNQTDSALCRMHVEPEQTYDKEIVSLRREMELPHESDSEVYGSLTSLDSENEGQSQFQELGKVC